MVIRKRGSYSTQCGKTECCVASISKGFVSTRRVKILVQSVQNMPGGN
jgi:hypothetical protein